MHYIGVNMGVKENFYNEVRIGSYVEIIISSKELIGRVISLDEKSVKIITKDNKSPCIDIDSISYYDVLPNDDSLNISKENDHTNTNIINHNNIFSIDREILSLNSNGIMFFDNLEKPEIPDIRKVAKLIDNNSIKNNVNGIVDSFLYTIEKLHINSPFDTNIDKNLKKMKDLIYEYPKYKILNTILGLMYSKSKYDIHTFESSEYFEKGNDNLIPFLLASNYGNYDKQLMYACRHFIYDNELNPYIIKFLITEMIKQNDFSLISKINISDRSVNSLYGFLSCIIIILDYKSIQYDKFLFQEFNVNKLKEILSLYSEKIIFNSNKEFLKFLFTEQKLTFYDEAKNAKENNDFINAEKLYKKAIESNDKIDLSVLDLIDLYRNESKYEEAYDYLEFYGKKYMDNDRYKSIKEELHKKIKEGAYKTNHKHNKNTKSYTVNKTASNIKSYGNDNYFITAQKYEVIDKDLDKAITFYKKAIEYGQRLSASVPNLVGIYNRLEWADKALELLSTHGKYMDREKFLYLKLAVLKKNIKKEYESEFEKIYDELIPLVQSNDRKEDLLLDKAYVMMTLENYDKSKNIYNNWLMKTRNKLNTEKHKHQRKYAFISLCKIYHKFGDETKAKEYASKVLYIDSSNEYARSIMSGKNVDNEDFTVEEDIYMNENTGISKFFENKIINLNLEDILKNKQMIKEGKYIGTEDEAIRIMDSIKYQTTGSYEAMSNDNFALAKLVRQILDRENNVINNKIVNEQRYFLYVSRGALYYGNYNLYGNELKCNIDTARYCYMQSCKIYNKSIDPVFKYVQTYFYSINDIKKMRATYNNKSESVNISDIIDMMKLKLQTSINLFVIGIMELFIHDTRFKKEILDYIFISGYKNEVISFLNIFNNISESDIDSIEKFENLWNISIRNYNNKLKTYIEKINEVIDCSFTSGQLQQNFFILKNLDLNQNTNDTDNDNISKLFDIFNKLIRYNQIAEFDYKSDILIEIDNLRKNLSEKISEYPTYFSYELLFQKLEKLQVKIINEANKLYGDSKPEISVELSGESSIIENELKVSVPIRFANKKNVQNAENVSINIYSENAEVLDNLGLEKLTLRGDGNHTERIFNFKINEQILKEQLLTIKIKITYEFKKNMSEMDEEEVVHEIPVDFNNFLFEPINNKFEAHKNGAEVKDKEMFYGRDEEIENIINLISDKNVKKCLALYGQTRTGKSSLLYHIERRLREKDAEGNIILNIGSIGDKDINGNDITSFFYALLNELEKELNKKYHSKLLEIIKTAEIDIDPYKLLENKDNAQIYFNSIFEKVCNIINDNNERKYNIIIMIDEFTYIYDWIRKGEMTDRFMKFWKAFIQNNDIFAIIIGQDHMMKFINDVRFTNDFGAVDNQKVTYLKEEYAKKLMYEPILYRGESRYKEGALDRLYELTSGSAYLIMNLCAGLVDYLNEKHSRYITKAHIDDYINKNLSLFDERFFQPQYDDKSDIENELQISEKNKEILKKIAQASNKREWAYLDGICNTDEDRKLLENLKERDVIIMDGARCKIKVSLYKEWIIKKYGF